MGEKKQRVPIVKIKKKKSFTSKALFFLFCFTGKKSCKEDGVTFKRIHIYQDYQAN